MMKRQRRWYSLGITHYSDCGHDFTWIEETICKNKRFWKIWLKMKRLAKTRIIGKIISRETYRILNIINKMSTNELFFAASLIFHPLIYKEKSRNSRGSWGGREQQKQKVRNNILKMNEWIGKLSNQHFQCTSRGSLRMKFMNSGKYWNEYLNGF